MSLTVRNCELDTRGRQRIVLPYDAIAPLLVVTDVALILIASLVGAGGYQLAVSDSLGDIDSLAGLGLIGSLAYCLSARQLGLYDLQSLLQPYRDYLRIVLSVLFVVLMLTATFFLLKVGSQFSRGSFVCFVALMTCGFLACRRLEKRLLRHALRSGNIIGRRAVLIGTHLELASVSPNALLAQFGIDEVTRIALPYRKADEPASAVDQAAAQASVDAARELDVQELLLCLSWGDTSQLQLLRERLRVLPLPVRLLPDRFVRSIWDLQTASEKTPLLINVQRAPLSRFERTIKRVFDLVIASFSLLVLSPLILLTALAVRLESPGPVIFRQHRKGFNGRRFQIYKFRTMRVVEDGYVVCQATRNDERVTRLGRVLRRASIDEIPQLFNVLKGEMSIVGPRPHAVAHDEAYGNIIGQYAFRHHVRPGITGWAQVNGFRGGTPYLEQMKQRVELDLWYISNWNIGLDLQILGRTCIELMRGHNAY